MQTIQNKRFYTMLAAFLLVWLASGIGPWYPADWLLENVLVFLLLPLLLLTRRSLPFSNTSYALIFLFLALHEVGAHYTYSHVPYNYWTQWLFGFDLNELMGWERNHYDRFVHFLYGLLLAYPIREIFLYVANVRGFWGYFLPLDLTMSSSMLFELLEWAAAVVFGGELGMAFLGTQGDEWDAHKDMALASLGATITMIVTAAVNIRAQKDFSREWAESLRVNRALKRKKIETGEY